MKIGMQLHPDRGVDAVIAEAKQADDQGYDSIWLSDHLMNPAGVHKADGPLDLVILGASLGMVTKQTRIAWGTLNYSFRRAPVLAKMLTSIDHLTRGRVICTIGAGWYKDEYDAYNIPFIEDHDERVEQSGEVVKLFKQLWTHPAPERVTFEGKHVQVRDLPFNPAPYQKPHPAIWIGGESEATLRNVKLYGDGWMTLSAGGRPEILKQVLSAPDWPTDREMTVVKGGRIALGETHEAAMAEAHAEWEAARAAVPQYTPATFEEFASREVIGTADECLDRIAEIESWGVNYMRLMFNNERSQDTVARLILPRLGELKERAPVAG
ncbi:MAG TPA: LLM class flavin-dependent oxidoreductase [Dehalococcoidia bacterium]|nr:LLM class flavin-dependent oxidoreductase [Dehalococcoidia bacterium]